MYVTDTIFSLFSYFLGDNSKFAKIFNIIATNMLNLIQAVVCIGYIAIVVQYLLPWVSMGASFGLATSLLFCALPFELLDSFVQNEQSNTDSKIGVIKRHPVLISLLSMFSALFGAFQSFIRNYRLVLNFSSTGAAVAIFSTINGLARRGAIIAGSNFSFFGGLAGFFAHFFVAYGNWDKLIILSRGRHRKSWAMTSKVIWSGLLITCIGLFLPSLLTPLLAVMSVGWLSGHVEFSPAVLRFLKLVALWLVCVAVKLYAPYPEKILLACLAASGLYVVLKAGSRPIKRLGMFFAPLVLPLGAALYTLVDFFNSFAICRDMGWLNTYTLIACAGFGVFSLCNVAMIWGYNAVRFMYDSSTKEEQLAGMQNKHPWFTYLYFHKHSVRRVSSYLKETMLCVLDLLNNYLALPVINAVLFPVLGFEISLYALSMCTVFYALNRLVVLYFQSSPDKIPYVNYGSKGSVGLRNDEQNEEPVSAKISRPNIADSDHDRPRVRC